MNSLNIPPGVLPAALVILAAVVAAGALAVRHVRGRALHGLSLALMAAAAGPPGRAADGPLCDAAADARRRSAGPLPTQGDPAAGEAARQPDGGTGRGYRPPGGWPDYDATDRRPR